MATFGAPSARFFESPLGVDSTPFLPIRVVLADDSVLLREGIARLLEDVGFEVVGQAGDADELLRKVRRTSRMWRSSTSACRRRTPTRVCAPRSEIRARPRGRRARALAVRRAGYALELIGESADGVGYLLKDRVGDVDEFTDAVRRVGEGGSALDPAVVVAAVGRRRARQPARA